MSKYQTPCRYDFVGSFLRPEKLKAAKKAFEEGTITKEELDRITDECVTEIVAKQKAAGFHAITDGEFRRKFWHLDFMWGFEGVAHEKDGGGVQFNGEMADLEATYLVGKVKAKGRAAGALPFGSSIIIHVRFVLCVRFRDNYLFFCLCDFCLNVLP